MLRPTRPVPRIGSVARIRHFGGRDEQATIVAVLDDGRRVAVEDGSGERQEFTLRRATAAFVLVGHQHSPRLRL